MKPTFTIRKNFHYQSILILFLLLASAVAGFSRERADLSVNPNLRSNSVNPSYLERYKEGLRTLYSFKNILAGFRENTSEEVKNNTAHTVYARAIAADTTIGGKCYSDIFRYCAGQEIEIEVEAEGGYQNYKWFKNDVEIAGATGAVYTITEPGSYYFTAEDAETCDAKLCCPYLVTQEQEFDAVVTKTDAVCATGTTGSITVTPTVGEISDYTYSLNGGPSQASNLFTNLAGGSYTVTVKNAAGCSVEKTVELVQPDGITASAETACVNDSTTATIVVSGGVKPYMYSLDGGAFGSDSVFAALTEGQHEVLVKDANNCTYKVTVDAYCECTPEIFEYCPGDTIQILAEALPGQGNYQWYKNGEAIAGATDSVYTITAAGTYHYTSGGDDTCEGELCCPIIVREKEAPSVNLTGGELSCTITSIQLATGSDPANTFSWSGPNGFTGNTPSVTVAESGTYIVTVTGASGCSVSDTAIVTRDSDVPTVAVNGGELTCDVTSLELTATASAGVTYSWSGPGSFTATTPTATATTAGEYVVTVTSVNGCIAKDTATVTQNSELPTVAVSGGELTCDVTSLELTATGSAGVTYSWSGPGGFTATTPAITATAAGDYVVTVTSVNGCIAKDTATVIQNNQLPTVAVSGGELTCKVTSLELTATGSAGVTYSWSGPGGFTATTPAITATAAGDYIVTVTSANGCIAKDTATVTQNSELPVVAVNNGELNCKVSSVELTATAGAGVTYSWSGPGGFTATTPAITATAAGNYIVTVTSANGCIAKDTATVTQNNELPTVAVSGGELTCKVTSLELTATGSAGVTYSWSGPDGFTANTPNISATVAGNYIVTVTSANGCTAKDTAKVTMAGAPTLAVTPSCVDNKGTVTLLASGGKAPYQYSKDGVTFQAEALFTGLANGNYVFTVKDANDCIFTATAVVKCEVECVPQIYTFCDKEAIDVTIEAEEGLTNYQWYRNGEAIAGAINRIYTATEPGRYHYTAGTGDQCDGILCCPIEITRYPGFVATAVAGVLDCKKGPLVPVTISVTGGTAPFAYSMDGITYISAAVFQVGSGTHKFYVKDGNGCVNETNAVVVPEIVLPKAPIVTVNKTMVCGNELATLTAGCAVGETIQWNNGMIGITIQVGVGTYTAICSDKCGESPASAPVTITNRPVPDAPIVGTDKTFLCGTELATLSGNCAVGQVIEWNNGKTGITIQVGIGVYTAVCKDECGKSVDSRQITITKDKVPGPPEVTTNKSSVCGDEKATLGAECAVGSYVVWNTHEVGNMIQVGAGIYTAVCKNDCGESESSGHITINKGENPAPPILKPSKVFVCGDEKASITATCPIGTTVLWSTKQSGETIYVGEGVYRAVCVNSCGQSEESIPVIISKDKAPDAPLVTTDKTTVCGNEKAKLYAHCESGIVDWGNGSFGNEIEVGEGTYSAKCSNSCGVSVSSMPITISRGGAPDKPTIFAEKTNVCGDELVKLVAYCASGTITWNGVTGYNSTVYVGQGIYSATCTNACGTSAASEKVVITKGGVPAKPIVSADVTSVCGEEKATLTGSCPTGGVLTWNDGSTGSPIQVGVGFYIATCVSACGTSAAADRIAIEPGVKPTRPTIVTNKTTLCEGEVATLSGSCLFGELKWSNGLTGTSIQVSVAGSYTAVCVNSCGTSDASSTILINKGPVPTQPVIQTNKLTVCGTDKAMLTGSCPTGGTLKWNNGSTGSPILVGVGTYTATCVNSCGVSIESAPVTIGNGATPSAPVITPVQAYVCDNDKTTLTATCASGTIRWNTNATTATISVGAGSYSAVCVSDCGVSASSVSVTVEQKHKPVPPIIVVADNSICDNTTTTLTATCPEGSTVVWDNGSTGNKRIAGPGKYTATCVNECGSSQTPIPVEIYGLPAPKAPVLTASKTALCGTEMATLTATCTSGTVLWNDNTTANPRQVGAGTYTAMCVNSCGTSVASTPVTITTQPAPTAPQITANKLSVCGDEKATLTGSCPTGGVLTWNDGSTGSPILVGAGTYTATCVSSCGTSPASTPVVIGSGSTPTAPSIVASKTALCGTEMATLTATCTSGTVQWNDNTTANPRQVGAGTYTATCVSSCGTSVASTPVTITTQPAPTAPQITANKLSVCGDEKATLTGSCPTGGVLTWNNGSTGSPILVGAGTYTATCVSSCGTSVASAPVVITTQPAPTAPSIVASKTTLCGTEMATLTATCTSGTVQWNDNTTANPRQVGAGTYTATCVSSCGTSVASIPVTITTQPAPTAPQITANKLSVCGDEKATLTGSCPTGGVLTWNNGSTGSPILVGAGTYTATCVSSCGTSVASTPVVITTQPAPTAPSIVASKTTLCGTEMATLTATCVSGTVQWNDNTTANPRQVGAGTYTATCVSSCGTSVASIPVVITTQPAPTAPQITANKLSVCGDEKATLTGSCPTGGVLTWNNSSTGSPILVGPGTYTATCVSSCGTSPASTPVVITSQPAPTAPQITANKTSVCGDEKATLTATCASGTVQWNDNTTANPRQVGAGTYTATCVTSCGASPASTPVVIGTGSTPAAPVVAAEKTTVCEGETTLLTAACATGTVLWNDNTTANPRQVGAGTYTAVCVTSCGNSPASTPVVITKGSKPAAPTVTTSVTTVCDNETATLTATCATGTVLWNDNVTANPRQAGAGTYTAVCVNACGGSANSNTVVINRGPVPSKPTVQTNRNTVCGTEKATLTATCATGGTLTWNTGQTGSPVLVGVGTYTATCVNACGSSEASAPIVIGDGSKPDAPVLTTSKSVLCGSETATLTATGCAGGTIHWSNGGTGTTQVVTAGTYTATCVTVCGTSAVSAAVTITQESAPANFTIATSTAKVCGTEKATLTATGCEGGTVTWSTGAKGNSLQAGAGTYTATCTTSCGGTVSAGPLVIGQENAPVAPSVTTNKGAVCGDEKATLTATGCTGTLTWYKPGTTAPVTIGNGATVQVGAGTYTATCTTSCGTSPASNPVTIGTSVKPAAPSVSADKATVCESEKATLTASGCAGTVTWSNSATGTSIQAGAGTYTATCTTECGTSSSSLPVTIGTSVKPAAPSVSADKLTVCDNEKATLTASGCAGTVTWSNSATGTSIQAGAGTYTATCTTSCGTSVASAPVTIGTSAKPAAPSVSADKATVCENEKATLTATGCAGTITWSTGQTVSVIQVGAGTYTATCTTGCGTSAASVPVTIGTSDKPAAPSVSADKATVCEGEKATLTATGCAGTVTWSTGQTVSVIQAGAGTYTATCTTSCGTSAASAPVTVGTSDKPAAPSVSADKATVCESERATLTATGCAGTVTWSNSATGTSIQAGAGTYTATCTTSCGTSAASAPVTVGTSDKPAAPSVSADKATVCESERATLTAAGCAGTVTWSNSATGTSIQAGAGTYTATCTTSCGTSAASAPVSIGMSDKPAAPSVSTDKSTVCESEVATLTASGCAGTVTWSNGATGTSIQVGAGTYTATCTTGCGTSEISSPVTIGTSERPAKPVITASGSSVCGTEQVTLTASGCSGTVTWSNGATGTSIQAGAGTYTTTCTTGCGTSDAATITISEGGSPEPPVVTADKGSICGSEKATLTATGCVGGVIRWSTGETGFQIQVGTGVYTATCVDACGNESIACIAVEVDNNATAPEAPVISASTDGVCGQELATLTANGCTGGTVIWSNGSEGHSIQVSAGSYTATCKTDCGESTVSNSVTIQAKGGTLSISSDKTAYCVGETVTLTASGCANGTVRWSNGATGNSITVQATATTSMTAVCSEGGAGSSCDFAVGNVEFNYEAQQNPNGMNTRFLLTNNAYEILQVKTTPKFENVQEGTYKVITLVYIGDIQGLVSGANYSDLNKGACYSDEETDISVCTPATPGNDCEAVGSITVRVKPAGECNGNGTGSCETAPVVMSSVGSATCLGTSVTLTAMNCSAQVVWNTGATGASINFVPTETGAYKFSAKCVNNAAGCESETSEVVTVNVVDALPKPTAIETLNNICPLAYVDLRNAILGAPTTGGTFEFRYGNSPSAALVTSAQVTTGVYYLFERNTAGCYSEGTPVNVVISDDCQNPVYPTSVDVAVQKTGDKETAEVNEEVTYTVTVSNAGTTGASDIRVRDIIPLGLEITQVGDHAFLENGEVVISLDTLAPGASVDVNYTGTVTRTGRIANKAQLESVAQKDTNQANDSSTWVINNVARVDSLIGLAKAVGTITRTEGNAYKVPFVFTLTNMGLKDLDHIRLTDTLSLTFGSAAVIDSIYLEADNGLTVNPEYTGKGESTDLLIADQSAIAAGATLNVRMDVYVNMGNNASVSFANSATTYAGTNGELSDRSTDGVNPDPDNDGDPTNNSTPTEFTIGGDGTPGYGIGAALAIVDSAFVNDGKAYEVKYLVQIRNYGADTVRNVFMTDTLMNAFANAPEFNVTGTPVITSQGSTLVVNPDFNGKDDVRLLLPDTSAVLAPGQTDTLEFKVTVVFGDNFGPYSTNVIAFAEDSSNVLTDTSNAGLEIIKHLSTPTVFNIADDDDPRSMVSVPEGFSPNGDGVNDNWKITLKGNAQIEKLIIVNRYGATLYEEDGETVTTSGWDGKANKGVIPGTGTVPTGTYYYKLKLVGKDKYIIDYITVER